MEQLQPTDLDSEWPLISVVIPTYNFGHLISYTLDSVLAQTYQKWECIIVDDGSLDNTEVVVTAYTQADKRFTYYKQPNSGPGKARNKGIALAKGSFLQLLDADDLLEPLKLEYQVGVLMENTKIDVLYGPTLAFQTTKLNQDEIGELTEDSVIRPTISGRGNPVIETFLKTTFFPSAGLIRKSLVLEIGMLNVALIQAEDWDLFLRLAQKNALFQYLRQTPPQAHALIRKHDSNNTLNFFRLQYYVVIMRQNFAKQCNDESLLQLNNTLIRKNLEDLVYQVQIDLNEGRRKAAIQRSMKLLGLLFTFRYFIYAVASVFFSAKLYYKITQFSFHKFFKGKGKENKISL
ncbi:hypothetical protein BH09BAC1_BH09BAC1_17480 [soil metagenome]